MKILHIIPSFGLGGMEKVLCTIANRAAPDSRHTILALDNNRAARQWLQRLHEPDTPENRSQGNNSINFLDFPPGLKRVSHFQAVSAVLRQTRPDILMTYGWGAIDAIWIGRLLGIKHILHSEHGVNIDEAHTTHWKRELVRKLAYRLAARIIVVTHEYSALMQQRYGLSADQVVRIPNGINTQRYAPSAFKRHSVRRDLGFERTDFVVGFVGRLDPIKNLDLLLKILACAAQRSPRLRLLIVGDGPDRERIERISRDEHLQNRIVFAGPQVDVLPYLRAMDTFLLTSFREQMPLTLLEAMAVGIPAIAPNVGEVPYIIDTGVNGFIHQVFDTAEAFATSLQTLESPAQRRTMGAAARQKVITCFQETDMVEHYQALLFGVSSRAAA